MSDVEDQDQEEVPEGMVRRTRRVRKKRKSKQSSQEGKKNADTLFAKAKDLLVGMENEDDQYGHVDVQEQVRRLKDKGEDERPLDDVWGTKRRSSSWLWIILVGMIVGVVAVVIGITFLVGDNPEPNAKVQDIDPIVGKLKKVNLSSGPLGWFNENSIQVLEDAKNIIGLVNSAESSEDFARFLRVSPDLGAETLDPELWGADCLTNPTSNFGWIPKVVGSSVEGAGLERGFLHLVGTRADGNPYEAYFIEMNDQVTLDWEATMGWSEMEVAEIAKEKPQKEIFLRCRVTKKASYDQMQGRFACSGYVVSGAIPDEFFLAYIPVSTIDSKMIEKGKAIDRSLKLLLNYGSFVSSEPPLENQKVTIRVRYNNDLGAGGAFEIVEFLYKDWVSP